MTYMNFRVCSSLLDLVSTVRLFNRAELLNHEDIVVQGREDWSREES